jgi:hypothetical protein
MRKNALPWSLNRMLTTPAETLSILTTLRGRVRWLRRILPVGLLLLVVIYEIGPAYWIHDALGEQYHFLAEILVYGTVGPVLAFLLLDLLDRWLEERETTKLKRSGWRKSTRTPKSVSSERRCTANAVCRQHPAGLAEIQLG